MDLSPSASPWPLTAECFRQCVYRFNNDGQFNTTVIAGGSLELIGAFIRIRSVLGTIGKDLDRDGAVQPGIGRLVDVPHPARSKRCRDHIRAEARPGSAWQCERDYTGSGMLVGLVAQCEARCHFAVGLASAAAKSSTES